MILGTILSNMGEGISGAASKTASKTKDGISKSKENYNKMIQSDAFQMIAGRHDHNAKLNAMYKKIKDDGAGSGASIASFIHKGWDNTIAADYRGTGAKRAGVVVARQAAGALITSPIEAGYRYATGTGTFTQKNGEKDIAGIPFI